MVEVHHTTTCMDIMEAVGWISSFVSTFHDLRFCDEILMVRLWVFGEFLPKFCGSGDLVFLWSLDLGSLCQFVSWELENFWI